MLLTREEFERQVFARDDHKCVICGDPAQDAHHLIERSLWTEPEEAHGYIVANGASVCATHHMAAERDLIPPQVFRKLCGLPTVLPKCLDPNQNYSKWGVPFRMPTRNVAKYPSTSYLDVSPGKHGGHDILKTEDLAEIPVVITTKMDGSNVVLRNGSMAARNGDTASHESFSMLKYLHAGFRHQIPYSIEIFGEWLYAKHSIHYTDALSLRSYLQVFAAYDMKYRLWLSWNEVKALADQIGYPTVPVLLEGTFAGWQLLGRVTRLGTDVIRDGHEGIVVRSIYPFHYGQFGKFVGKYVREGHVQTDEHWTRGPVVKNAVQK